MVYNLDFIWKKVDELMRDTGFIEDLNEELAKTWEKLGAKIDELGVGKSWVEQKEAWSPEAGHWTGQLGVKR